MKILTTSATIDAIKGVIEAQEGKPQNIRLFMAGMGWSGPSFGLALDEQKDNDAINTEHGISFVMEKDLYEQFGEMRVEYMNNGYFVGPSNQEESDCGSCSSCN